MCGCFFLMIRRPPRSTLARSSAASDVYKRQEFNNGYLEQFEKAGFMATGINPESKLVEIIELKAVSYTHLRAHETVLDIVCRLLLETKNNSLSDAESC